MDDAEFDRALIAAAFDLAAQRGWTRLRVADAARVAALPLGRARTRFPGKVAILLRFGRLADQAALAGSVAEGSVKDRLFDMLMRRLDFLQAHRAGVLALLRALPADPPASVLLGMANLCSMRWMLDAAGVGGRFPLGALRAKALLAVWLWTVQAWQRDSTEDLAGSMAALDQALTRAEQIESWLHRRNAVESPSVQAQPVEESPTDGPGDNSVPPAP